jgi:hypothetical protein
MRIFIRYNYVVDRTDVIGEGNGLITALLFAAAALSVVSCASAQDDASDCGGIAALTEAAFLYQFANNQSSLQKTAAVYFISIEDNRDPSAQLLTRFTGHRPPVKPLSAAKRTDDGIIDPESGRRSLVFRVGEIRFAAPTEAQLRGGYEEGRLSASRITLRASCGGGRWSLVPSGPTVLS